MKLSPISHHQQPRSSLARRAACLLASAWLFSGAASAAQPDALEPACSDQPQADAIRAQRATFNDAIAEKNVEAIASVLADEVVLITGTDSDPFHGRAEQLELWRRNFALPERLVYTRTPECIELSGRFPIALERGHWRGERADGADFAAGRYSAKWRHDGSTWQLEAEIFMTDDCSVSICPEAIETP